MSMSVYLDNNATTSLKKEVLDAYHSAVKQAAPPKEQKEEPKKAKSAAKKKSSDLEL